MISPPLLKTGDTVAIVATGKKISRDDLAAAITVVESWGLRAITGEHIVTDDHPYLAATDDKRKADLQAAIDDPRVRAVLCARGGYGTTRILDGIDLHGLSKAPKWIAGFSDVTSLLLAVFRNGVKCLHGSMPVLLGNARWKASTDSLRNILFEGPHEIMAAAHPANRQGSGSGMLVGGNLSIIADSLGTSCEPDTTGAILVLEEIDEDLYRLDRMLTHLRRAGKFDHLAGLVIGHITDLRDTSGFVDTFEVMLHDKVHDRSYPVAFGLPTGHENPNLSWVVGQQTMLHVGNEGTILKPLANLS